MNRHKLAFSLIGIFIVQLSYAGYFKQIGRASCRERVCLYV